MSRWRSSGKDPPGGQDRGREGEERISAGGQAGVLVSGLPLLQSLTREAFAVPARMLRAWEARSRCASSCGDPLSGDTSVDGAG